MGIASVLIHVPINDLAKIAEERSHAWVPIPSMGDPNEAPGAWFQPSTVITIAVIFKFNIKAY